MADLARHEQLGKRLVGLDAAADAGGFTQIIDELAEQLTATGQSVTFTNTTGANVTALNVRYCVPDSAGGGGTATTLALYVNGTFRQTINLTSAQTWCYQSSGGDHSWNQSPSGGQPHIFWDEAHFFISAPAVPSGATITLKKDSGNTAAFYRIDVVDMENPPGPLSQPANSLSITDYGAVVNSPSFDSEPAIQSCINAAQSQGKSVWIPSGTFYLHNSSPSISATGITVEGAGSWYSVIYSNPTLPATPNGNIFYPTSATVRNLAFDSNSTSGGPGDGQPGGLNVKGSNWVVDKVWIQHMGAGIWADGTNGTVSNTRVDCAWGDGININNGNGGTNNNIGNNLTVNNCFVRGTGDDGIAINAGNSPGCVQMDHPKVTNCTAVAPWWANNIGIYGGTNIEVSNNLVMDSCGAWGISIGQFGTTGFPTQSGSVINNTIVHGGSTGWFPSPGGNSAMIVGNTAAVTNLTVDGNIVNDSVFGGITLLYCGTGVVVQNNNVDSPRTTGVQILSGATGSAQLNYNAVTSLQSGQSAYLNSAGSSFTPTLNANTWQSTKKLITGHTVWLRAAANSNYVRADNSGANPLIANSASVSTWEQYVVVDAGGGKIGLRNVGNSKYVCADNGGANPLIANRTAVGPWESFVEIDAGGTSVGLRAMVNNKYVCAEGGGASALIANRTALGLWETFAVGP